MVRTLSIFGTLAFFGAILIIQFVDGGVAVGVVLLLLALAIGGVLAVRRMFLKVREVVGQASSFARSDIQHVRIAEVGEPKGIFFPKSNVILEFEGTDGNPLRIDRELPVPFPAAWGYRLSRRFNLPLIGRQPVTNLVAFELRREGLDVDIGRAAPRPEAAGEPPKPA
jgi:hypothetical protein